MSGLISLKICDFPVILLEISNFSSRPQRKCCASVKILHSGIDAKHKIWILTDLIYIYKNIPSCISTWTSFPFYFKGDKTVRGEAGSWRNHSDAHHQDSALPCEANQPAVCGQRGGAGAESSHRSLSVSCVSIHTVSPVCHRALAGMHLNRGRK